MPSTADRALLVVDLAATVFLGIEGGMAAIEGRLDLFGVMVLSFATALGGGLVRDLLIGATPPASIRDARYPLAAFLGGGLAILLYQSVRQVPAALMVGIDAAGLGLFAVAGAAKALDHRIGPFMAVLMGTITGVGGGTIRDILLARVPAVLRVEIYAVAALAGAAVMVVGVRRGWPRAPSSVSSSARWPPGSSGICLPSQVRSDRSCRGNALETARPFGQRAAPLASSGRPAPLLQACIERRFVCLTPCRSRLALISTTTARWPRSCAAPAAPARRPLSTTGRTTGSMG